MVPKIPSTTRTINSRRHHFRLRVAFVDPEGLSQRLSELDSPLRRYHFGLFVPASASSTLTAVELWLLVSSSSLSRNFFIFVESLLDILKYTGRTDTTVSDFFSWSMVNDGT